jgi:predicted CXXCH cytochrome family protein
VPYRGVRASQAQRDAALELARQAGTPLLEGTYMDRMNIDYRPVSESVTGDRRLFWVSGTGNSVRRAKSDLPLYSRGSAGVPEGVPFVECTSCHDPHTTNDLFLRVKNDQNQLCMTCHVK